MPPKNGRQSGGRDRRTFLRGIGATISAAGAVGIAGCLDDEYSGEWTLAFEDRFEGGTLDTDRWNLGYGWGAHTDWSLEQIREDNVWVDDENDQLVIEQSHDGDQYFSGAVNTKDIHAQQYGRWEARLRIPSASSGLLPAFWMKPNNEDWPPEIDVVEFFGNTTESYHALHYRDCLHRKREDSDRNEVGEDLSEDFHVFGCEWSPDGVRWTVDDQEVFRSTAGSDGRCRHLNYGEPFYTLLNVHIADVESVGDPSDLEDWPYEFRTDWVRIWERT